MACGASRLPLTPRARAHLNAKGAVQLFVEGLRADSHPLIERFIRTMPFTVSEEGTPANEELLGCCRALALLREAAPRRPLRAPSPRTGVAAEAARGPIAPRCHRHASLHLA